jgi:capsular polysaccharide biosynthesis protein
MELRLIGKVLLRRWWLIAIPVVMVLLVSVVTYSPPPAAGFNVGMNFIVSQTPAELAQNPDENRYYNWLTSEYIVNGLTDWVIGGEFKTAVSAQLATQGIDAPPHTFHVVADNVRSKLQLSVQHGNAETLAQIMDATVVVLSTQNAAALPQLGGETAVIIPVDQPVVTAIPSGIRSQLDIPLRVALALFVGVGLALLAEYLDTTIRSRDETEQLGLPVLGEIPKNRKS